MEATKANGKEDRRRGRDCSSCASQVTHCQRRQRLLSAACRGTGGYDSTWRHAWGHNSEISEEKDEEGTTWTIGQHAAKGGHRGCCVAGRCPQPTDCGACSSATPEALAPAGSTSPQVVAIDLLRAAGAVQVSLDSRQRPHPPVQRLQLRKLSSAGQQEGWRWASRRIRHLGRHSHKCLVAPSPKIAPAASSQAPSR